MNLRTLVIIFAISSVCINLTYSANRKDDESGSSNPKREFMKRLLSFGRNKEVETTRDKERKKGRMRSSSSSQGSTSKGKEVQEQPEKTGMTHESGPMISRNKSRLKFTREQLMTLLRLILTTEHDYDHGLGIIDWNAIYTEWVSKFGNISSKPKVTTRGKLMLNRILENFRHKEEGIDWTDILNTNLLRIYFETEEGNKSSHDRRMTTMWHKVYPEYSNPFPRYLYERAERMMDSVRREIHSEAAPRTGQRSAVEWTSDQDKFFRDLWYSHNRTKHGTKKKYIYDSVMQMYGPLNTLNIDQVYDRAKYVRNISGKQPLMSDLMVNSTWEPGASSHYPSGTERSIRNPELSYGDMYFNLQLDPVDSRNQSMVRIHQHPERGSHNSDSD